MTTPLTKRWQPLAALVVLLALTGYADGNARTTTGRVFFASSLPKASAEDRRQISRILADLAAAYGLTKVDTGNPQKVFYMPPPSGLGVSLSAKDQPDPQGGGPTVIITVGPAARDLQPSAQREALINALEAALQKAFGARLKPL